MSRTVVAVLIALVILSGCSAIELQPQIETWTVAATDPVSTIGHGAILNPEGKEVDATPQFVIGAQRFYLKNLYVRANEKQRLEFKAKQQRLQGITPLAERDQILVNSALIGWLIDTVKPENAANLTMRNSVLRNESARVSQTKLTAPRDLLERLKQEALAIPNSP
jgi:hypothetical protein